MAGSCRPKLQARTRRFWDTKAASPRKSDAKGLASLPSGFDGRLSHTYPQMPRTFNTSQPVPAALLRREVSLAVEERGQRLQGVEGDVEDSPVAAEVL
jgi:hypothetical protein